MGIYKNYRTNHTSEIEGVLLDFGNGEKIRLARAGGSNKNFLRAAERLQRKCAGEVRNRTEAEAARLLAEVYADSVVLDWEGVKDAEGKDLPFSRENVIKLLSDLPEFFAEVRARAEGLALFRDEALETDSKN